MPRPVSKLMSDGMNQSKNNWLYKDTLLIIHKLLKHISFEYHISVRLKILINSLIIALPAFVQYLFFDEPEYLISFILCSGLLSSVFLLSRAGLILTSPFVIISFAYTVFLVIYKKSLGSASIMAIFNTKIEVVINFVLSPKMIHGTLMFIIVFIFYLRFIILKRKTHEDEIVLPKEKRFIAVIVMAVTAIFLFLGRNCLVSAYPFSLLRDTGSYVKIVSEMKENETKRYVFNGSLETGFRDKKGTFILIVGESARRASWSLYGYKRKTNVFLKGVYDKYPDNFIIFKNYITTGQTTYPSLMSIFSVIPSMNFVDISKFPSFVRILKNVAFKTYFISTYENIFIDFINSDENIITKSSDDDDLLPILKKVLDDKKIHKKFIVLHLKGSHFAFSDYSYSYRDYISPSENPIMDKYDNSIVHTDIFLKNIAETVMESSEPLCVWYMSDHGENLNDYRDGNFGHGCAGFTRYELEIPSVMFFNNAFIENNPRIRTIEKHSNDLVSHSNVSHTIMGLSGLYPKEYLKKCDLSSAKYRYEEPYLLDVDLFPIKYSKADIE